MNIGIILTAIFAPACVMVILSVVQKSNTTISKTMSDEYFVVLLPKFVLVIGSTCAIMSALVLLGFTIFSEELPHVIFYITFGLGIWLGMYLILKALRFRVIVKREKITVYSICSRPYAFTFNEIISAVRQVKRNQVKSERVVLKTKSGKKLIVESSEISYKRFLKRIKSEVKSEFLFGFE